MMKAIFFAIAFCNQFGCYRENDAYPTKEECESHIAQSYAVNGEHIPQPMCIKVDGPIFSKEQL